MTVLTIRTDKPEAEIGLYENADELAYEKWQAHRELAETIHMQIAKILQSNDISWNDLTGIVCFKGPGSFTGLRIGLSVGNTLAYSLGIPIVGEAGEDWIQKGIKDLNSGINESIASPEYGADAFTTKPRK